MLSPDWHWSSRGLEQYSHLFTLPALLGSFAMTAMAECYHVHYRSKQGCERLLYHFPFPACRPLHRHTPLAAVQKTELPRPMRFVSSGATGLSGASSDECRKAAWKKWLKGSDHAHRSNSIHEDQFYIGTRSSWAAAIIHTRLMIESQTVHDWLRSREFRLGYGGSQNLQEDVMVQWVRDHRLKGIMHEE